MTIARQLFVGILLGILTSSYGLSISDGLFWMIIIGGNIAFGLLSLK